jgi:hypothetical protein
MALMWVVCVFLVAASAGSLQGYTVGGTVSGMAAGQQIMLTNNGGDALTLTGPGISEGGDQIISRSNAARS